MRFELRDGQWAEFRERITHGDDKRIRLQYTRADKDEEASLELNTLVVRIFVRDWYVKDPDGNPIPWADPDAVDRAPDDIIDALVPECSKRWKPDVKVDPPTPPPSDS